jgi:hypothetical protein
MAVRRGGGRWVAHVQVPVSERDAALLEAVRSEGDQAVLRVGQGTKVKVDDVNCAQCRRGIERCADGDPEAPCTHLN